MRRARAIETELTCRYIPKSRVLPFTDARRLALHMRSVASLIVPFLFSLARTAHSQADAAFPPEPPPEESDSSEEGADSSEEGAAPSAPPEEEPPGSSGSAPPPRAKPAPPASASESNPYGSPPAPAPPIPGNPYGPVPHRPLTPGANPYTGAVPAAPPEQAQVPKEIEQTNWSVGGGLATETPSAVGMSGYQGNYSALSRFSSTLLFERRLSRSLFLLVQPRLLYHKAADEPLDPDFETTTFEESRLGIEAGIRWVANPGGAIELGMSHLAHVEYNRFVQQGRYGWLSFGAERAEAEQIAVGLSNAFIAERRLIPHLWLRLGVGLFGLQYYSTKILARDEEEDEETGETTEIEQDARTKGLRGGLSPTLALQVRLTF